MNKFNMPKAPISVYDDTLRGTGNETLRANLKHEKMQKDLENDALLVENYYGQFKNDEASRIMDFNGSFDRIIELETNIKRELLRESIGMIFYNAIPLDEDFKEMHKEHLMTAFEDKLNEAVDSKDVNETVKKIGEKSPQLDKVAKSIEKKTKEIKNKKIKETDKDDKDKKQSKINDISDVVFMPDEEDTSIDIEKYDKDEVTNVIKDKVVKVIEDETASEEERKRISDEINTEKQLNEQVKIFKKNNIKEHTLFKSLMISNYKQSIKDLKLSESANESGIEVSSYGELNNGNVSINMDMILAESIINYTLLETLYTLKITDYNNEKIRELSESLCFK